MPIPLLINPHSGGGRGRRVGQVAVERLRALGHAVAAEVVEGAERLQERVRSLREGGTELLLLCGGDGTVHRALPELVGGPTALGVVPAGRGNDLAQALGFPTRLDRAIRALSKAMEWQTVRVVDLGRVNGRYFATAATCGLDSRVAEWARRTSRGPLPSWAYLLGTIRVLLSDPPRRIRLVADGRAIHDDLALMCPALNVPRYGGRFQMAPLAQMDDGLLNYCWVERLPPCRAALLIPRALRGTHLDHPAVHPGTARALLLESDPPEAIYADGEPVATTPCRVEVVPQALRVLVFPPALAV
ncbi:MAG: sphingosine kinase [Candidatus Poribacteria bacterium]|nr:MAG: sphingosine kinase [Candidatus Poribacteria bacterium]